MGIYEKQIRLCNINICICGGDIPSSAAADWISVSENKFIFL